MHERIFINDKPIDFISKVDSNFEYITLKYPDNYLEVNVKSNSNDDVFLSGIYNKYLDKKLIEKIENEDSNIYKIYSGSVIINGNDIRIDMSLPGGEGYAAGYETEK